MPVWDFAHRPGHDVAKRDAVAEEASNGKRLRHRLRTPPPHGRAVETTCNCTVEPIFGLIRSVFGLRQFLLRGSQSFQGK